MEGIDIGIVMDRLMPGADYGACTSYDELVRTWRDARQPPTLAQLEAEWAKYLAEKSAADSSEANDRLALRALRDKLRSGQNLTQAELRTALIWILRKLAL